VCLLAAVFSSAPAQAQEHIRDTNAHSWWVYAGDHALKGRWALYAEVQVRRSDFASITQQFQSRDAITYTLNPNIRLTTGYVWTYTGRYGDFPVARAFGEHRTYQQIAIRQTIPRLTMEHRYRLEQRFIQNFTGAADDYFWRYQNRLRYQFRADTPLGHSQKWYFFGGTELLLGFGVNKGASMFDQNRAFVGIGRVLNSRNKLEAGYMNQFIVQRNGRIDESNHTFRVQFSSSEPLFRRRSP
jgi:hypothetical protein